MKEPSGMNSITMSNLRRVKTSIAMPVFVLLTMALCHQSRAQNASPAKDNPAPQQKPRLSAPDWSQSPLDEVQAAAAGGDMFAAFYLGRLYETGTLVSHDYAQAAKYYRIAAEKGHAAAQNNMGFLFERGYGVNRDFGEAEKWFRRAADQGLALGEANLGWMYYSGRGLERDRDRAEFWFRRAADQGLAYAQFMMGQLAERQKTLGNTLVGNYQVASEWYARAAEQGHARASFELGNLFYYGKLGHNYPEAARWFRQAAEQGDTEAVFRLGELFSRNHDDLPANLSEAVRWFRIAAEQDNTKAQYRLGCLLLEGEGIAHDPAEAQKWLRRAADGGSAEAALKLAVENNPSPDSVLDSINREALEVASYNAEGETRLILAKAYEQGRGGGVDMRMAAETYWRILNLGPDKDRNEALRRVINLYAQERVTFHPSSVYSPNNPEKLASLLKSYSRRITAAESLRQVGIMFDQGKVLPNDKALAVNWLTRAAHAGDSLAMHRIGEMWATGLGDVADPAEAVLWYGRAATNGLAVGQMHLGLAYQSGSGTARDVVEAASWLRLAADQGLKEARDALDTLERDLNAEQLESIRRRTGELINRVLNASESKRPAPSRIQ